ncbi:MAG TPA: response regulator [Candidatus Scybalocola faecigallinarum]|uniref:Stage 0 sporulation protein A homolog n=1 Tax=Candidatus Scybalocola faecigallinarum TaxID=2840941 RepID=A0A9D1F7V9_9FIRM|nr:response regulator [Candidatus Scybalocola faecigallinarum]
MKLLKLVIVDGEPILLSGLLNTYDWAGMGFKVVGSAQSGEQAIQVIKAVRPHVVLTDIRMKQITGLMVMEEIQKLDIECLFIVLSAYRDFDYAQQACDLGAYAYLLKPIEDEKLQETMQSAYKTCIQRMEHEAKFESWEKLLLKDQNSFLQVVVYKYVQNRIPEAKVEDVFRTLGDMPGNDDRFITVCVDIDLAYKITNSLDYEASRFALMERLEDTLGKKYFFWRVDRQDENTAFIIQTRDKNAVRTLKAMLEHVKKDEQSPVVAAISKPYKGISGIKKSYMEAQHLFGMASISGASAFTVAEDLEIQVPEGSGDEMDDKVINAVRRNSMKALKDAFIQMIYSLPREEERQCQYLHRMMLKTEFMLRDSYGLTEEIQEKFRNYYYNLQSLNGAKTVDVCYKILCDTIEVRLSQAQQDETKYFKEYMSEAVAYIQEHLQDEELSIVSVASHIYLNPVYFGRVFKNTFQMTFKQYLLKQRMEKAKTLLLEGSGSIGSICDAVGIHNPSYFSHLFKQYTGMLPSEYKKEHEG